MYMLYQREGTTKAVFQNKNISVKRNMNKTEGRKYSKMHVVVKQEDEKEMKMHTWRTAHGESYI